MSRAALVIPADLSAEELDRLARIIDLCRDIHHQRRAMKEYRAMHARRVAAMEADIARKQDDLEMLRAGGELTTAVQS